MSTAAIHLRAAAKDRTLVVIFSLAVLMLLLDLALLFWKLPAIGAAQEIIALHYNIFFGVDRTGTWRLAFAAPIFGTLVIAANLALSVALHATERFVSRALAAASLMANVLIFIGSLFLILANI